jgi:predicted phage-related endonuclease
MIKHKDYPFLFGTLDGELTDNETGKKGVLEIKTTEVLSSMHKEKWNDQIPQNYYIQILHYLAVTGYEFVVLRALIKTEWNGKKRVTIRDYYFDRAEVQKDIDYLVGEEVKFWNEYVKTKKEPPLRLPQI